MRTISSMTNRVKLYSLVCYAATVEILDYAVKNKMEIMLGVWVNADDKSNAAEIKVLERILSKYGDKGVITDIMIGNEPILVAGASLSQVVSSAKKVRAATKAAGAPEIRLGTAEIEQVWKGEDVDSPSVGKVAGIDMTPLVKQLDWIGLNLHSYYASFEPTKGLAADYVHNVQLGMEDFFSKQSISIPIYITETGYPTAGPVNTFAGRSATPSLAGLENFMTSMESLARKNKMVVCMFLAIFGCHSVLAESICTH
jgi:exo-beta-1,3-glucanase (GH17 family)